MRRSFILICLLSLSQIGWAGTFTSRNDISNGWHQASSWDAVGDADGIPDSDDDVTILAGHTIIVSTGSGNVCLNLVVEGTLQVNNLSLLYIHGDYTVNGSETGSGSIGFVGNNNRDISGSGSFSANTRYSFSRDRNILAGTTIVKNANINSSLGGNVTLRNFGNFTLGGLGTTSGTIVNESGATLTITRYYISANPFILDASATGNTVIFSFSDANYRIKIPLNNTFHHLRITGTTSKYLDQNIIVNGNLICNSGFSLNGRNLNLRGNFINTSNLFSSPLASVFSFDGTATQTISGLITTTTNVSNLVINNSAGVSVIGGNLRINNSLTVNSGNFNVGTNRVTLFSDASTTAFIAPSAGSISGNMIVQRHIAARAAGYSDMSSPVSISTFADWGNELLLVYGYNPPSLYPSAWSYEESPAFNYVPVTSSGQALTPGVGYEVYLDSDGSQTSFNATTLTSVGTPNMGNVSVGVIADNDGWNLVGNPYAAHISWDAVRTTGGVPMNSQFMFYDEGSQDFALGNPGEELAPAQGFWIEATSGGTLTFTENMKTSSTSSTFRSAKVPSFGLRLASLEGISFTSNTWFNFENGSVNFDQDADVSFKKVPHPTAPALFSMTLEGKNLRKNTLGNISEMSIPLGFSVGRSGIYSISAQELDLALIQGYTCIQLEDKLTGVITDLTSAAYTFKAHEEEAQDRFVLHLSKNTLACGKDGFDAAQIVTIEPIQNGVNITFVKTTEEMATVEIFDMMGRSIQAPVKVNTENYSYFFELPAQASGIYVVTVRTGMDVTTRKINR